jgi:hypothetical protein
VESGKPERVLEGLRPVFVELPRYRETRPQEARQLRWAWLKFLKEAGAAGRHGQPTVDDRSRCREPLMFLARFVRVR